MAQKRKASEVDVADIRKVYSLFVDVKRSAQFLKEYEMEFMFSEDTDTKMQEWRVVADDKLRKHF